MNIARCWRFISSAHRNKPKFAEARNHVTQMTALESWAVRDKPDFDRLAVPDASDTFQETGRRLDP